MEAYRHQSLWNTDFLRYLLEEFGFHVSQHAPGESRYLHLQCLERRIDRDEHPFDLLGAVCLDAGKPKKSKSRKLPSLSSDSEQISPEYVTTQFIPNSRTGRHLFQIAATYAHALRTDVGCRIPWRHDLNTWKLMSYLGVRVPRVRMAAVILIRNIQESRFSYGVHPGYGPSRRVERLLSE